MPKPKIYIGKINSDTPVLQMMSAKTANEREASLPIKLQGEWKARLHFSHPKANVWARMLDFLQQNNRPVYAELDNDTDAILRLYMPIAAKVLDIAPSAEVVHVGLNTSQAVHYLRRNNPDFEQFMGLLQSSKDSAITIMVTARHHDFEIIDVRDLPASFGNDGPPEPPPPPVPDPPVSPARAIELFNMMKAESCTPCNSNSPCIPFRYPYDGCWIRAHLMCYLMMAEGETPEKIWIGYGGLHALSSNVPECYVNWGWHVAPTLMMTDPGGGPDTKIVIDPSLCDGPVTPDEWRALQRIDATLTPSSWDGYHYLASGTASQAEAEADMEEYRIRLDDLCTEFGPSPYACPIVKQCAIIVDRSTISKDEVDAMLSISNPAVIEAAFYVVVDGFTPTELGITAATLTGTPDVSPAITPAPAIAQMSTAVMPTIKLEYPTHLTRPQRITWKYQISFTGSSGFVNEVEEINIHAAISTVAADGKIYLIKQPNPYEIDGETTWLSTDLRVFQINQDDSKFNKQMLADANDFITTVINNLNTGNTGGQTFDNDISVNQQTSRLELSAMVDGTPVYNFAIAKVRYRALSVSATDVRVFFRLFPASSTSLEFNQSTTYRRDTSGGVTRPLLGIISDEIVTIPCFAEARVDSSTTALTAQTDTPNVQTLPPNPAGTEVVRYFGCWLDFNQEAAQFPLTTTSHNGPWTSGRVSVKEHVRNEHQCLVAEIAFDSTPVPANASPSTSDKLAQRNLAIVESDNPGDIASHRIPHTFEIKPTRLQKGDDQPDELMIDWNNIPVGCSATLFFSGTSANEILELAAKTYRGHNLVRVDAHTLQCETGGMTYIPIPEASGSNYACMISIDLPDNVKKGQVYAVVVHQVTTAYGGHILTHETAGAATTAKYRRILGSFQVTIPVTVKENMLNHQLRLLSNLRWIQRAIPENNRWFPVFNRYVGQIADRVDAIGGDSSEVMPSPNGEWKQKDNKLCALLGFMTILLLASAVIIIGSLNTSWMSIAAGATLALLLGIGSYWIKNCKPSICKLFKASFFGFGLGTLMLGIFLLAGVTIPQLMPTFIASLIITALLALGCWKRGCFK